MGSTARKLLFVHGVRFAALLGIGGGSIDVTRSSRLLWVVADLRALLMAIEWFDSRIDVEDPGQLKCWGNTIEDFGLQPLESGLFRNAFHGSPHRVLTYRVLHV